MFLREAAGPGGWHEFTPAATAGTRNAVGVDRPGLSENDWIVTLNAEFTDADDISVSYEGLGFQTSHSRHLAQLWPAEPRTPSEALANPLVLESTGDVNAAELYAALFAGGIADYEDVQRRAITVSGGNDGSVPAARGVASLARAAGQHRRHRDRGGPGQLGAWEHRRPVRNLLFGHAEDNRFRIAVLDPPADQDIAEHPRDTSADRLQLCGALLAVDRGDQSARAARRREHPEGAGAAALRRGLRHLRAQRLAARCVEDSGQRDRAHRRRFEREVNHPQQEVLNPIGINCFRYPLRTRQPAVWRPARDLRPRGRLCQRPPLPQLPEALDLRVDAMGGV